jgi:hypothetical protein
MTTTDPAGELLTALDNAVKRAAAGANGAELTMRVAMAAVTVDAVGDVRRNLALSAVKLATRAAARLDSRDVTVSTAELAAVAQACAMASLALGEL